LFNLALTSSVAFPTSTISLTTTGTSGAATLVGATLNIPNYSSALSSYVPYTGATTDVYLGSNSISSRFYYSEGDASAGAIYLKQRTSVTNSATGYSSLSAFGGYSFQCSLNNGTLNRIFRLNAFNLDGTNIRTYTLPDADGTLALVGGSGVGTVTSVAALTLGTSGTDLSSTVATGTTTPVITLNVPTASATNRGALSSADWTTFNNKQSALTNPVTGTGTINTHSKFTSASVIGNSMVSDDATTLTSLGATRSNLYIKAANNTYYGQLAFTNGTNASYGGISYNNSGQYMQFETNGSEWMRLNSTGNLSIGNTNNTYTLDVSGTGRFTSTLTAGATTLNGNLEFASGYFINMPWASDTRTMWERYFSATYFQRISSNGTLRQLRLESNGAYGNASIVLDGQSNSTVTTSITSDITYVSGKLGIGTSSPNQLLELSNGGNDLYLRITRGAQYGTFGLNSTGIQIASAATDPLYFSTNGTERMRITSGGNVLIGTTSDVGYKSYILQTINREGLTVECNNASFDYSALLIKTARTTTGGSYRFTTFNNGTSDKLYVLDSGSVYNTTGTYGTISDATLKENIIDATPKLEDILQLKVRNFNLIGDETKQIGFIAQEFEEVFPSMIDIDGKSGKKAIKTSVLVPILVKAIQELSKQNEELSNRLIKLESK
jgi:hypothetical protein